MSSLDRIEERIVESIGVKERLISQGAVDVIADMAEMMIAALEGGHAIYVAGNGGSAADSQHIAGEMVGRFLMRRRALRCVALTTDTSVITSVGNDLGFQDIFFRQVEALVKDGDVLLALSTSGESRNINLAVEEAKRLGAKVIALSGRKGGELAVLADLCLTVPAESSPRIQEAHILIAHILCELVERGVCSDE